MAEERIETFSIYIDKPGRISVPRHIRENLRIVGKAAEVEIKIKVKKVYETEEA